MTEQTRVRIEDFSGLETSIQPTRLAPSFFQVDEGGDHYQQGSWKLRRGMTRMSPAPLAAGVATIFGGETVTGNFALILIDTSGNLTGYTFLAFGGEDVEGFGSGGEGEGGFGE